MSQWQKMESAPRDGERVLLSFPGFVCEAYFETDEGHQGWSAANTHWTDAQGDHLPEPDGWMPMPQPLKAEQK